MLILALILSYLIGAIPTAYILGKCGPGIDIRQHGSGNVGATNAFRTLGKGLGTLVLCLDILKGVIAVTLIADLCATTSIIERLSMAVVVVIGHNWTIFLQFKGGKGIATTLGVLIGLAIKSQGVIPVLLGTLGIWMITFLIFRIVSLSSLIGAVALPVLMAVTAQPIELFFLGVIFAIFIVIRHRPNIKRLLQGQEPRVKSTKKK